MPPKEKWLALKRRWFYLAGRREAVLPFFQNGPHLESEQLAFVLNILPRMPSGKNRDGRPSGLPSLHSE